MIIDNPFETIKSAVDKCVNLAKETFGPSSGKVFISKTTHFGVYDDGVQVLRDIELENEAENAVIRLIRETSGKTSDRAGDGTTGALIMLQGLIEEASKTKKTGREVELELKQGLKEAIEQLKAQSKPIESKADLKNAALISYDNEEMAEIIATLFHKLGKEGVITVKNGNTINNFAEISDGVKLYGCINTLMAGELENPYILVTDLEITEARDVLGLMETVAKAGTRSMVLICKKLEGFALATVNKNIMENKFVTLAIDMPKTETRQKLEDIALLTGAKFVSELNGDRLKDVKIEAFGRADRFISGMEESHIVGQKGNQDLLSKETIKLRLERENETDPKRRKVIDDRLAFLTNKLAVIHIGAPTENELKAIRRKVENAVASVKSAFNHGVVAGGGFALARIKTSSEILNYALQYPSTQLLVNVGELDLENPKAYEIHQKLLKNDAFNVITKKQGGMLEVGVIDPVNTLITAIENAVSIAGLLLTIRGAIIETKDETKP